MRAVCRFILLLLAGLLLAGCVNKEPEERAAFMQWLSARALAAPDAGLPATDEAQRDAFGDYAEHYAVLADFQVAARAARRTLHQAIEHEQLHSVAQLQARRAALRDDQQALAQARTALHEALAQAGAARAELEQPVDLQPLYAQAYERFVTAEAGRLDGWFAIAEAALGDALRAADFIAAHRDQMLVSADAAAVRDPSVQRELNRLLGALNSHAAAVGRARAALSPGPAD
ncbi:DUF3053 family protein [Bordetella petrii]|uniref:DUF3053 family protein n=1 Tax=Bordetella petrii TaxID=94624 RepID=UPI0004ADF2CB|nr:DUF3053 family protein [Bordetella petrii]